MGESMITSFDGTKLYLKKETAADNKAVIVIVHGLCEILMNFWMIPM